MEEMSTGRDVVKSGSESIQLFGQFPKIIDNIIADTFTNKQISHILHMDFT